MDSQHNLTEARVINLWEEARKKATTTAGRDELDRVLQGIDENFEELLETVIHDAAA